MKEAIIEFAKKNGYNSAEYLCEWNNYTCYEPIFKENAVSYIGLPLLILEDSEGNLRMSTPEEALEQIDDYN